MLHILSWSMQSIVNLRNPVTHNHIAGVDVILEMIQEQIFLLQLQFNPVSLRFGVLLKLGEAPRVIKGWDIYLASLGNLIIRIKYSGFIGVDRNFFQFEHAGIVHTGKQLVVKGLNNCHLGVICIILLDAIFINQLVHFLVEAYALPDESPGTEDGADEIHCGFINFFSADLLFKHAFGMIYWHRELVVKELVNVRAEELISGVDVSNAFPSENDGEATL